MIIFLVKIRTAEMSEIFILNFIEFNKRVSLDIADNNVRGCSDCDQIGVLGVYSRNEGLTRGKRELFG
jgi:hypothetical protein